MSDGRKRALTVTFGLLLISFCVAYVYFFLRYCSLDTAPPAWDSAYLQEFPAKVKAAFRNDGWFAALGSFFSERFFKAPLSMYGTLPAVLLGQSGPVGLRIDNLIVAFVGGAFFFRFARAYGSRTFAFGLTAAFLASPYLLQFTRIELAEVYLSVTTLIFYLLLLEGDDFRKRKKSVVLGLVFACGLMAKLSFPLIVFAPSMWIFLRSMRDGRRDGSLRLRLRNLAWALGAALLLFLPLAGRNWKHMWRHLRAQYGWVGQEYRAGDYFSATYFSKYVEAWSSYLGAFWIGLLLLVLLALPALVWRRLRKKKQGQDTEHLSGSPKGGVARAELLVKAPADGKATVLGPLSAAFGLNAVYCYFFPVFDPRFSVGSFVSLQLIAVVGLGYIFGRVGEEGGARAGGSRIGALALLLAALSLLSSSYQNAKAPLLASLAWPFGQSSRVFPPPQQTPDLREAILDRLRGARGGLKTIGLAGDHEHLNVDNLRLFAIERGLELEFIQIGYLGPSLSIEERVQRAKAAEAWILILPSASATHSAWPSRFAAPAAALLERMPGLRRLSFDESLGDGSELRLYVRDRD